MVGVGQFAEGLARRRAPHRQAHGLRRIGGIVAGIAVGVVIVLWVIARVAGHL
jgi:Co/Zn/Cd efflux system component